MKLPLPSISASITCSDSGNRGFTPTWADDVSLLVTRVDQVAEAVALTVQFFTEELAGAGLSANQGRGKTEAILGLHGPGSRQVGASS